MAHYTSQLQMTAQSSCCKPRAGFPSFLLSCPQLTERISPPPASSPARIMCYSKLLLQDAAGKPDTPVSSRYNEFSVRNTALATSTGVERLCRVPGQSTMFFYLSLLLSPDIADHGGEHQHRSPPPRLHSPRTVTPLPSPGLASASGAAATAAE